MKTDTIHILLIEDNPDDARLIQEFLKTPPGRNFETYWETSLAAGLDILTTNRVDVVLSDLGLPDSQGADTFTQLIAACPEIPVIVITGSNDHAMGLSAVQKGAQDFLVKGQLDEYLLVRTIMYAIERKQMESSLQKRIKELNVLHNMSIIAEISSSEEDYAIGIIDLIPLGFQYPEKTCCKLDIEGILYQGKNFETCFHFYGSDIQYNERKVGRIEVGMMDFIARGASVTFLQEEKELIITISKLIGDYVGRKNAILEIKNALEKAMESDRLKSAFLATMSHELRTPLNAVIGFSQLINADTPMEDVLEFTKHILKGGHHLLAIIEDILHISVLESGLVDMNIENHQLLRLVDQLNVWIREEQAKMHKQHLSVRSSFRELDSNLWIRTDKEKLIQILMNLLNNALKFTNEGSVEYGALKELREDRPHLKFWIRDTGIGIPEKAKDIIFDIFRQADETHTRTHGGTGLGLSVAKKLVELLGGSIWVESEVGKGSTFWFTIPFEGENHVEERLHHEEKSGQELTFAGRTILIAEDEDSNYELLEILLSAIGFNIFWAKNGLEAVQMCADHDEIDLILMDLKMSVMNGYEATWIIRESNPLIPIIAQTAYAMPADIEEAIKAGCTDFITKPIRKEELFRLLKKNMLKS